MIRRYLTGALALAVSLALTGCDLPDLNLEKMGWGDDRETQEAEAPPTVTNPYAGLPAYQPYPDAPMGALGLNVADYLEGEPQTIEARITRLENALTGIQKDLAALAPVVQRLAVIPPTVKRESLMDKTQSMPTLPASAPPKALSAAPQQEKQTTPSQTQPAQAAQPQKESAATSQPKTIKPVTRSNRAIDRSGPPTVKRLRLGEHDTKTRMVLDITKEAQYRYDIDTMEDLLIIELPDVKWDARTNWKSNDHPLISSYTASPIDGGTRLIVGLKNDARVVKELSIAPNSSPYYRIVLDFAR